MAGKIFIAILAIFLLLGAMRTPIIDGIKGWRVEEQTQGAVVTTGVGVTTGNVTLTAELFQDDTAEVTAISSNVSGDSPVASSYETATRVLTIAGLTSSAVHSLSIEYYAESENAVMQVAGPFLGIMIFGGFIVAILYGVFKKGRGG